MTHIKRVVTGALDPPHALTQWTPAMTSTLPSPLSVLQQHRVLGQLAAAALETGTTRAFEKRLGTHKFPGPVAAELESGVTLPLLVQRLMGAYRMEAAAGAALLLVAAAFAVFWICDRWGRGHADA